MRRIYKILLLVAVLLMFFVLPAMASVTEPAPPETSDAQGPTTAAVMAGLVTFGLIVKAAVSAIKKAVPALTGLWTMLTASVVGTLVAGAFDFQAAAALAEKYELTGVVGRVPDGPFGWIISGIAIGAASGFFAELAGTSGPKAAAAQAETALARKQFDEGYNPGDPPINVSNLPPV